MCNPTQHGGFVFHTDQLCHRCGACTSAVEGGFNGVDGVGNVSVSLILERGVVMHDANKISAEQIRDIIEDRGFEADVLSTNVESPRVDTIDSAYAAAAAPKCVGTVVAIEGMTCGACTSAVEGAFKDVPGVKNFSISLLSERAVIDHDPTVLTAEQIAEMIEDRGFGATVVESSELEEEKTNASSGPALVRTIQAITTVAIEGMTCGACTSAVDSGFKDVDGLLKFNISLLAERAVITHDPTKLSAEQIVEIIEDRGFGAQIVSTQSEAADTTQTSSSTAQFKVYGIPNAAAATELEEKLKALNGVISVKLSLATSRLTVVHQSGIIGMRAIVEAVEENGYNALVADNDDNNAQLESLSKTREITEWRRAFKTSVSFAVPVFFISMILPMFPAVDFGSFEIIPGLFLGDILGLVLTIPVQFGIGKRFYISAYKSVKHGTPTMDVLVVLGTSAAFFFSCVAMLVSFLIPPGKSWVGWAGRG